MSSYIREPKTHFRPIASDYKTVADDPERLIWYGLCGMWTDDWDKVAGDGIPHCTTCGAPGFQITAREWFEGAKKYEADGHPGYVDNLQQLKEHCPKQDIPEKPHVGDQNG